MKILEQENRKAYKAMSTDYVFDKLNKLEDVIAIAKSLEASGVNITGILVSELGDYEDAPLRRGYPSIEEMSEVLNDFKGKVIEEYLINGEYEETLVSASIYPELNKMSVKYQPKVQEELKSMIEESFNSKDEVNNINNIQHL